MRRRPSAFMVVRWQQKLYALLGVVDVVCIVSVLRKSRMWCEESTWLCTLFPRGEVATRLCNNNNNNSKEAKACKGSTYLPRLMNKQLRRRLQQQWRRMWLRVMQKRPMPAKSSCHDETSTLTRHCVTISFRWDVRKAKCCGMVLYVQDASSSTDKLLAPSCERLRPPWNQSDTFYAKSLQRQPYSTY